MKLAIFGASGKTGHHLIEQALAAGHAVKALVRDPGKLRFTHPSLAVISGNALDAASVKRTIEGTGAVLSALGIGAGNPQGAITLAVRNIAEAMSACGVRRLIAMSSIGIGDSKDQIPFTFRMAMLAVPVLRQTMADLAAMEEFIRRSALDWIIVRPGGLQDGPARGQWQVSTGRDRLTAGDIPRADVATFMLKQLEEDTWLRQSPGVT